MIGRADYGKPVSVTLWLWLFAVGVAQVAAWPALPAGYAVPGVFVALALVVGAVPVLASGDSGTDSRRNLLRRVPGFLLPFLLGSAWALAWDRHAMDQRLPLALHGTDFEVTLRVTSLPEARPASFSYRRPQGAAGNLRDISFTAEIETAPVPALVGQKVRLGWYATDDAARLKAGSRWHMAVRLKRPHGSVNPHTFDYEAWLLQQGVYATGYVRETSVVPRLLQAGEGLPAIRERVRDGIRAQALQHGVLVRALLLGDKSGLTDSDRSLLRNTGTAHLLAISGLHVGMVAGFFLLLGSLLSRCLGLYWPHNPRALAGCCAIAGAAGYTLVSGSSLSAQRALIMTTVLIAAWLWRRRVSAGLAFALALFLVLVLQPLAVLNAGFWLSFGAVAALLVRFSARYRIQPAGLGQTPFRQRTGSFAAGLLERTRSAWQAQWAVLVALLLPSLLFFSGVSLSGFLVNLIAIPWLGLLILPAVMLGAVSPLGWLTRVCWQFADGQLGSLMRFLAWSDSQLSSWHWMSAPDTAVFLLALAGALLLLMPRGLPGKSLGWCMIPAIIAGALPWQAHSAKELNVTVLDVGQGLSVVVNSGAHQLVFDAGPDAPSGWSAGRSIVAPYLIGEGAQVLDALVISHGDRDHAGGAVGLAESVVIRELIAPGALADRIATSWPAMLRHQSCSAGGEQNWGALRVRWLWPFDRPGMRPVSGEENDHSCVALLEWYGRRVLLTGDISRGTEQVLVKKYPDFAPVDLLVAPHHGSRTSSSPALIRWARPANVVFSTGFRHHFGHPHAAVVARYQKNGSRLFNTADAGAVTFIWQADNLPPDVVCARDGSGFWLSTIGDDTVTGSLFRCR